MQWVSDANYLGHLRVVIPNNKSITHAMLKIGKRTLTFNQAAICEMDYPEYVQILISDDATKMAIIPCVNVTDNTAIPFYYHVYNKKKEAYLPPKVVSISDKSLARAIRSQMGWGDKAMLCSPIRFREHPHCLFFELDKAFTNEERKNQCKREMSISDYPRYEETMSSMKPLALAR